MHRKGRVSLPAACQPAARFHSNLSDNPRTLYIATYYAEDAIEQSSNHLPSQFMHEVVRGEASGRVRCSTYEMQLPEKPTETSFFAQQARAIG